MVAASVISKRQIARNKEKKREFGQMVFLLAVDSTVSGLYNNS
jgi:hypothetical protein